MANYKQKYSINENFFDNWTNEMAYVLGFTAADGNVYKTTLSWDLTNKYPSNFSLLQKFNQIMKSNYPIKKRKHSHKLVISNKKISKKIKKHNIVPNKSKILLFPSIPNEQLNHFIRGFLDGDGWISIRTRKNSRREICIGFSNGSYNFMKSLQEILSEKCDVKKLNLQTKKRKTKQGKESITYQMEAYSSNAIKLIDFIYKNSEKNVYLERKFLKAQKAKKIIKDALIKQKLKKETKSKFKKEMKTLLEQYLHKEKLKGTQIAQILGVHSSTVYRWLNETGVRMKSKRGSEEWKTRILQN